MAQLTRAQTLDALHSIWGTYVERFNRLTPQAQVDFLIQQGYERFTDLLAHVIAWWEEGQRNIQAMLDEPNWVEQDHDVDTFNRQAVDRFREQGEADVLAAFAAKIESWEDMIARLSDSAFENPRIVDRLHIELIGHGDEHRLPEKI